MRSTGLRVVFTVFAAMPVLLAFTAFSDAAFSADPPAAPAVSTFASVDDLADQVESYVEDMETAVKDESEYKDSAEKMVKDANTLIVIALALGVSDKDNAYKASAAGIVKAAQEVAAAKDYAAAKAGVDAVKAAIAAKAGGADALKWEKAASLAELMKAVPTINTKLKGGLKKESRFKKSAKKAGGYATVLAVIAQGSMANSADTEKPAEADKWFKFCGDMRDAAAEVGAACAKKDHAAAKAAMDKLQESCHACHVVFHEAALSLE